jgi:excisionase family DNA binding protein
LRLTSPGLAQTIRARLDEAVASNPALAVWLLWVEAFLMLTPAEAADRLGVSLSLIYQLCAERRLPHYRIGGDRRRGKIVIDEKDLDAFLAGCRVHGDGPPGVPVTPTTACRAISRRVPCFWLRWL